jgi:hypothetical protein
MVDINRLIQEFEPYLIFDEGFFCFVLITSNTGMTIKEQIHVSIDLETTNVI